ncbi:hypothetical protein AVEN_211123-1, partial [Araneus ventricosus]
MLVLKWIILYLGESNFADITLFHVLVSRIIGIPPSPIMLPHRGGCGDPGWNGR